VPTPVTNRVTPIAVGDMAPAFELDSINGKRVALSQLLTDGAAVLVFYRGHW
jgi:peroxiredoxin